MNRRWTLIALSMISLLMVGCGESSVPRKSMVKKGKVEIINNVFDDKHSTVYIRVESPEAGKSDDSILEIMTKKKDWEEKFPNKKIISMSVVTGDGGGHGHPMAMGLLIHYEIAKE